MNPLDKPTDMRRPAEWMVQIDERILEVLASEGNMSPIGASREGQTARVPIGKAYAGQRLRKLRDAGFVIEVDEGLYGISERGSKFLTGEFDASDVPDPTVDGGEQESGDSSAPSR